MIESYYRPRNKISGVFILCIFIIIVWFIAFPPEVEKSNKPIITFSLEALELTLQEILHAQSFSASVFVNTLAVEDDVTKNHLTLLSMSKQKPKQQHRLLNYNNQSLLISVDDGWELFEEEHSTYIKSDEQWELFDYVHSSINPLKHLLNVSLYHVNMIEDNNTIYYIIPIPHQDTSYEVTYVLTIDQQNLYIDKFTIFIYDNRKSELEIIQYIFEQWNDDSNRDIIEATKENIRRVILN